MSLNYGTAFYTVMVLSIILVFWLEALTPLDNTRNSLRHLGRNFTLWLIAFFCADYLVADFWINIPALLMQQPWGVFYWLPLPADWMLIVAGVLILDLASYLYHRLSHRVGLLWRFHAVHHTDTTLDLSTSLRAHPVELVLANFWRFGFALLFGIPIWVIGFRELLIFPSLFLQHANVRLPVRLERALGYVLVTPTIHRLHHSIERSEHDSNYGDGLIIWDRLLGSFSRPLAQKPEQYGVMDCEGDRYQTVDGMLLTPFRIRAR